MRRGGRSRLRQRGDVDLPLARPVELAEEDSLPAAERELPVVERDEHLGAHERRADVRRGVRPVRVLDMLPAPPVLDDLLERSLEVARNRGIRALVDRHARGRVRHVHERGGRAVRVAQRVLHRFRDVDELRPSVRLHVDHTHGRYPRSGVRRPALRARAGRVSGRGGPFHRRARRGGVPPPLGLSRRFGWELDALGEQGRAVLDSTERLWEDWGDRLFRSRAGVALTEAQRWDVARVFRATQWDPFFPKDRMLPALEATLTDLGVDLRTQENVELDLEERPKKSPRAFCAPIEVPGRVVLVIKPIGGPDDWRALFHEAGHTEHFAHTSASLSVEERRLGDNAVTEGWAMLLEHLTIDPAWLTRRLDFPRPAEYAAEGATQLLWLVRRYCAKLIYEIEFHSSP